ncbi:MAG TPA: TetR/AcrR family transcriptional regulator [Actinocrinis sp.]|nr:TetR/AcrR family transcriptional regulator [Actinocrinis sp.]
MARYHHGDLANALTRVAADLARRGGPDAVVLREAARRVGVSPTAAYRHFGAHEDLLRAVRSHAQDALAHAMESAATDSQNPRTLTHTLAEAYIRFALAEPGLFRTAFHRTGDSALEYRPFRLLGAAEVPAWAAVHGFAVLLLDGPLRHLTPEQRGAALGATLEALTPTP